MTNPSILSINGGSSSIKFAQYQTGEPLKRGHYGKIDRIGLSGTNLTFNDAITNQQDSPKLAPDGKSAASFLLDWLEEQKGFESVQAVGHRVTFRQRHPKLPQVACFDMAFHRTIPRVAQLLPIPRRYDAKGVQRYGFHGLSYAYLMEELARLGDPAATTGRVILAHLGNGASMAAVRDGKSIDTSMSFTPTSGLVMSTRCGDLDPSLGPYLARTEQMTTEQFFKMVNHEPRLRGVSEISSDAVTLGGLDMFVFAGGIGENAPRVRACICDGLGFLGIEIEEKRNAASDGVISTDASRVTVRVIQTDEDLMIARSVRGILKTDTASEKSATKGTL